MNELENVKLARERYIEAKANLREADAQMCAAHRLLKGAEHEFDDAMREFDAAYVVRL